MSNNKYSHLEQGVVEALSLQKEDRIRWLEAKRWIGYPLASDILNRLDKLIKLEKVDRMPNLLLYGETNNGKTSILKEFINNNLSL